MKLPVSDERLALSESLDDAYADLRSASGVESTDLGFWVSRYVDCKAVLGDESFSSNVYSGDNTAQDHGNLLFMDPPEHTELRRSVSRSLPRDNELYGAFVSDTCDRLFRNLADKTTIEVVNDIAQPVAARVTAHILGLKTVDVEWLRASLNVLRELMDPLVDDAAASVARAASQRLVHTFARTLRDPDRRSTDGFLGTLLSEHRGDDSVRSGFVLGSTAVMLAHASYENTANFIANAVFLGLENDNIRQRLADASDSPDTIEDLLRLCSPAHVVARRAMANTRISDVDIAVGSRVFLMLGSANRDLPEVRVNASLGGTRDAVHLAFGYGRHSCLGAGLARSEARVVLERFFQQFPRCRRVEPEDWRPSLTMRGLNSLKVERQPD
jgi:cytochrome P450